MKISQLSANKPVTFSLEIFPPKRDRPIESIYPTIDRISVLKPDFISVTYGAGGSAIGQQSTCNLVRYIQEKHSIPALAHITCINSDKAAVDTMIEMLTEAGIENVLALRGDRVPDVQPSPDFAHATDLIAHINERSGNRFDIAAACYPEGHPNSDCVEDDIKFVKKKVELGAKHLISQLFFDNEDFYHMAELCEKEGINVPIHAGIMPVTNARQIERMVSTCGAKIPVKLAKIMARYGDDDKAMFDAGLCYATEQIVDLLASGVRGIHLYAMNNPVVVETIYGNIKSLIDSANTVKA